MATQTKEKGITDGRWIREDRERGLFKVSREAFTSQAVFERERERIFGKCWLYLGHGSELQSANDFVTRKVAGHELIFNRDRKGEFRAFFNTCPHRGAMVAREKCGNALGFKCFYHGWAFNNNGKYATRYPKGVYPDDFGKAGDSVDLTPVPRLEQYRDFYFINFDADAVSLDEYLAGSTEILDLVSDHSPHGMEIVGGVQEYSIRANWKLLVENSFDGYHAAETHETYFEYLFDAIGGTAEEALSKMSGESHSYDYGNGHAAIEGQAPWGRPIGRSIPAWGERGEQDVAAIIAELEGRVGKERASRIANGDRNAVIFPNLVINDIMAITVRSLYPTGPNEIRVSSYALAPKGESPEYRKRRLDNFLEFLGPGGFATPDDVEALESAQTGYGNAQFAPWNDISRGMLKEHPANDDEAQMRCFWRQWAKLMEGE
jgi:p-cumate 2,3-dioxygenase alpha subunit